MPKKIDYKTERKTIKLYIIKKLSTIEISKILPVSSTTVNNILKRYGYSRRSISESKVGKNRGSILPQTKIIKLYIKGKTAQEVADIVGFSKRSILNVLKNNNIPRKRCGWADYHNPSKETILTIKKLYLRGLTLKQVAKKTNLSYRRVSAILASIRIVRKRGLKGEKNPNFGTKWNKKTRNKIYKSKTGFDFNDYLKQLPAYKEYKLRVTYVTNKQQIKSLPNFNKRGRAGTVGAYQLDHKFSIMEGFKQNISPEIIGNINNLEFIPWKENTSKNNKCSITIFELKKSIRK